MRYGIFTSAKKLSLTVIVMLLFILSLTVENYAQITQPYRFEREQKNFDDYYNVIPLKENGIALFRERDKYKNNNKLWELIFLDTMLQEKSKLELEVKDRHKMMGYEVSDQQLYFLFRTGETTKNDLVLIEISYDGKEVERYNVKPELDFRLTHFIKVGANFIFGGYVSNEAVIVLFEPESNNLKVIPGFFQKDTELVDLRTNLNKTFNTVLIDRTSRGEKKVVLRTFDQNGKQLLEDIVPIEENITLQTGITSTLKREDLIIAGTWGDRNSKQSLGFYTLTIDPFSNQKIQFIDFGRLDHFVDYLNTKRADRIKATAEANAAAGKTASFTSYVMPFRIEESDKGFYLLAEVYSPSGNSSMNYTNPYYYNPYGYPYGMNPFWPGYYYPGMRRMYRPHMYGQNSKTASEVKILSTVLLALDASGNVRWDQSIKLDEIKIPAVEQVGDFLVSDNEAFLIYKKESELKVKNIKLSSDSVNTVTEKIRTSETQDVIRSERENDNGVRHWFGNSFYAWGYQTIRNATKESRVRDVFYINRIDTK